MNITMPDFMAENPAAMGSPFVMEAAANAAKATGGVVAPATIWAPPSFSGGGGGGEAEQDDGVDPSARWSLHIQPPSIRGVVLDSDSDDDGGGGDGGSPGAAGRGFDGFMSRDEIKQQAQRIAAASPKREKAEH